MTRVLPRRIFGWRAVLLALAAVVAAALPARADWAILRNGRSLYVTGYQRQGAFYILRLPGGETRLPVTAVLRFEPEDVFPSAVVQPRQAPGPYAALVRHAAVKNGLSPSLLSSVIRVESDFRPRAVSRKHALGLMQLMPATARALAVRDPFDLAQNVQAGAQYLKKLLGQFGTLNLALAAYNAGPGTVHSYGGVPPFSETRNYIARVRRDMEQTVAPNPETGTVELTCAPLALSCRQQAVSQSGVPAGALR